MSEVLPRNLVSYFGYGFATIVFVYMTLVVTTVFLASEQTRLMASVADGQASIGKLETEYYDAIVTIDAMDPATLGLVTPANTTYARASTVQVALTEAGN